MFNLFDTLKQPSSFVSYGFIESIDLTNVLVKDAFSSVVISDPLERVLTY